MSESNKKLTIIKKNNKILSLPISRTVYVTPTLVPLHRYQTYYFYGY